MAMNRDHVTDRRSGHLRLRVWYFSDAGKEFSVNEALAGACESVAPKGWRVTPASVRHTSQGCGDLFVPVEVDLHFEWSEASPCPTAPDVLMRLFFNESLQVIENFFQERQKQPQHVTIHAQGRDIWPDENQAYSRVQVLNSLALQFDMVSSPVPPKPNIRRLFLKIIQCAARGVSRACAISRGVRSIVELVQEGRRSLPDAMPDILGQFSEDIPPLPAAQEAVVSKTEAKIQATWDEVFSSMGCIDDMVNDIRRYTHRLKNNRGIGNGQLYKLLIAIVATRKVVFQHQLKANEFRMLIAQKHREGGSERALWIAGGSTDLALAALLLLGVFPLIPAGVSYVLATTGAYHVGVACYEEFDRSANRTAENYASVAIEFGNALQGLHNAIAAMVCRQVLGIKSLTEWDWDNLKDHFRALGVDTATLKPEQYATQLATQAMERLEVTHTKLGEVRNQATELANVTAVQTATSVTPST